MAVYLEIDRRALNDFCEVASPPRLAFFGSGLRDDFEPSSDVDALVELGPEHVPGLIGFGAIERGSAGCSVGGARIWSRSRSQSLHPARTRSMP
jgi:hypothetical protein